MDPESDRDLVQHGPVQILPVPWYNKPRILPGAGAVVVVLSEGYITRGSGISWARQHPRTTCPGSVGPAAPVFWTLLRARSWFCPVKPACIPSA